MAKSFKEELLLVMDQKNHWGWQALTRPGLQKSQLLIHFQQEYETYVRDFPIFLARVLGRMDVENAQLKKEFAENLYEEQTGGLSKAISKGKSHPELFLKMMKGMGYPKKSFDSIHFLPTSLAYRCFLDRVTLVDDWRIGAAVMTLFVEGSVMDRQKIKAGYKEKESVSVKLKNHPMLKFYGLKSKDADLIKAHHAIEGSHRRSAWETLLKVIPKDLERPVLKRMEQALELWLLFRDGICLEMGLEPEHYRSIVMANLS